MSGGAEQTRWLQGCLRQLVDPGLVVDGIPGGRTTAALKEFQREHGLQADGVAGPRTIAALKAASASGPAGPQASAGLQTMAVAQEEPVAEEVDGEAEASEAGAVAAVSVAPQGGAGYVERRVKVRVYGTIAKESPLLVPVPGSSPGPKRLHVLAARAFSAMAVAVQRDLGIELKAASAWRAHRWTSREQYEAVLIAKYKSVKVGKAYLAFDSPHETGLAVDFGVGGLTPSRASINFQRQQPLHRWLVEHASEFGWYPYKTEPWHWEYPLSLEAYRSGVVEADDAGPPEEAVSFGVGGEEDDEEAVIEDWDLEELPSG